LVPYKKQRNGPELDETQDATNKLITTARIMVERTIGRLKVFNCLCAPWRNRLWFHRVLMFEPLSEQCAVKAWIFGFVPNRLFSHVSFCSIPIKCHIRVQTSIFNDIHCFLHAG
jgi:hypothetical protein